MTTTPVPVNLTTDLCEGRSIHFSAPAGLPPLPAAAHEVPVELAWEGGRGLSHSFAMSVKHKGNAIALNGHDCGLFIVDEGPIPIYVDIWTPYRALNSTRKIMVGTAKVRMAGSETGALTHDGFRMPMLSCGNPISSPLVKSNTSGGNTVFIGATDLDVDSGWAAIAITMAKEAVDAVIDIISFGEATAEDQAKKLEEKVGGLGKGIFLPSAPGAKDLIGIGVGFGRSVLSSYQTGWRTPISLKVGKSSKTTGWGYSVTYDPAKHEIKHQFSVTDLDKKGNVSVSEDQDGWHSDAHAPWAEDKAPDGYVVDPEKGLVKKP